MKTQELLEKIEPKIEQAYEEHMSLPNNRQRQPIDPLEVLARVSATNSSDVLEFGPILRERFQDHTTNFAQEYGVDIKAITNASFLVNLLTEDNLPHYTATLYGLASDSEAWKVWNDEWTAEEDSHGVLMRDLALSTGIIGTDDMINSVDYQVARTSQLRNGTEIAPTSTHHAFSYLALQELLTKEAHNNLSWLLDSTSRKALRPVSGDEHNHYEFYRKLSQASLEVEPDETLIAMANVHSNFDMPGQIGIPGYKHLAKTIAISGIFDLTTIVKSERQIVDKLEVGNAEPQSDAGKQAQIDVLQQSSDEAIAASVIFMEDLRDMEMNKHKKGELLPFILGRTIDFSYAGSGDHKRRTGIMTLTTTP